jgi:acid phosphatase family membrane protein YuiD
MAQGIKLILGIFREKRFNFRWLVGTGGFPSAHAAGATALATSTGLKFGFETPLFALTCIFAVVTMFDAQGVRRAIGKQAELLNKIMDEMYYKGKVHEDRLRELIGHTPLEVIVGGVLGILVGIACQ